MSAVVLWFHLVAASVWVGGLVVLGAVVATLRRAGVDREVLRAVARTFGRVSWTAMGVAVLTGAIQAIDRIGDPVLAVKMGTVALTVLLAGWHQLFAGSQRPAVRGALQGLILLSSLGIVAASIAL
jgi:putative copper export protein